MLLPCTLPLFFLQYFLNVVNVVRKSDAQKKAEAKNSGRENDEGKDGLDDEDFEWGPNMASIMRLGSNVAEYVHPTHHVAKHGDNLKKAAEQRAKDQMERFRNWHNTHGKKHHGKEAADDTLTEDDLPWLCERFVAFQATLLCRLQPFESRNLIQNCFATASIRARTGPGSSRS